MSSLSRATTFRVEQIEKHPNADALDIITVDGFPSIVKRGEYKEGDIAVFIPPDMVVPDTEEYAFLKGRRRIRAIKLRGTFSAGLVVKAPSDYDTEGVDVTEIMNIVPWEALTPNEAKFAGDWAPTPPGAIKYTDVESLRKYQNVLNIGEHVYITEKIHGANVRYYLDTDLNFHVGSRNHWIKEDETNSYWKVANSLGLKDILYPGYIYFGELIGVQDLRYGFDSGNPSLAFFDRYDVAKGVFSDVNEAIMDFEHLERDYGIGRSLMLYDGYWNGFEAHKHLAEGLTNIPNANHVREGFVVKPVFERYDHKVGRVILKLHGEGYLTRK